MPGGPSRLFSKWQGQIWSWANNAVGSLSWEEVLLGEYGTVDKALVYNDMVILGLPLPAATTLSYAIVISKRLHHQVLGLEIFFFPDCMLHWFCVVCIFSSLPSYLPCRKSLLCIPLSYSSYSLISGLPWPIPPLVNFTAQFSGPQTQWHGCRITIPPTPPPIAESISVEGF